MAEKRNPQVVNEESLKVTSVLESSHEHAVVDRDATPDERALGALGYKQEFKRDLSIVESFSVSFSILGLLPSIASTLTYGLGYSGTGGLIWGWLIAGIMLQSVAFSMAELCSSMPTAGGLYYAAAVLAPEGWGPAFSWFVGWSNFCGFVTNPCSLNYTLASMIVTCGMITNPGYVPETWHTYLIFLLLLIINGAICMQSTKFVGYVNVAGTVWNISLVLIFLVWFPVGSINSPRTNDSYAVWTTFENGTAWPVGWAVIMGFLTVIWTLSGYDAPFHLAEECSNANIASPRAIVLTAQSGLYLGWAIVMVIAYTVKDIPAVVSGQYGQPFGSLCIQVLGTRSGLVLFALTMVGQFFCGQGVTIAASRIIFAYSRDGAIVGSRWWSKVNPHTKTPVIATWGVLFIGAMLGLLAFAGPVAIGAAFSIGAIGQYTAFVTPVALKLFGGGGRFRPGPWSLGKFSKPTNALACMWLAVFVPAVCFPAVRGSDLTAQTMNWTIVIYGGAMSLAMGHYLISGRKWFKGPRINVEHLDQCITPGLRMTESREGQVPVREMKRE